MTYRAGKPDGTNDTHNNPIGENGNAAIGFRYEIPARQGRAVRLKKGQVLEVINPKGHQVCDFFAVVDGVPDEALSAEHCRTALGRIYVQTGDVLVTNRRRPILELIEDTSPSVHDMLIAACDQPRYEDLGVEGYHDNCTDNFKMSLLAVGEKPTHVPSPLNIWMNIPVGKDGSYTWEAPVAKAGDFVRLKARLDCIAVMSACPQDITPVNGINTKPTGLEFELLSV